MPVGLQQHLVDGILLGAILALPALGIALIWRVQGFPNLAHGSVMTVGAYAAWYGIAVAGLPAPLAFAAALAAAAAAGLGMHLLVYNPLAGRPMFNLFLASIGVELVIRYGIIATFGADLQTFPNTAERGIRFGSVTVRPVDLLTLAVALAALLGVWWLFKYTQIGRRLRAISDNPTLAQLSGVDPGRIVIFMWVLVSVLAGAAGILLGIRNVVSPTMGWDVLLLAFAAAIFGGISDPFGAAVGAFLMGIVSQVGIIWLPTSYEEGIAFVLITLILLLRPYGLFGVAARI